MAKSMVGSGSPTPVLQSQLTNEWDWTIESRAAYVWAIDRLKWHRVKGTVGDVGAGTGEGAKMLMRAGYDVVCVDKIVGITDPSLRFVEMSYNRQKVRGLGWDAVVMIGMLGYDNGWRRHLDAAMHDAPVILATLTGDVVRTGWMKPQPTITKNMPWSYMEWARV